MSDDAKRAAARAAAADLPTEGIIGLGSGSTAALFIEEVGKLVAAGRKLTGVATSEASRVLAEKFRIPLAPDDGPWDILVTVDGADEVDARLNLIKGGGAAHLREKIVNSASRRNVIVVDASKISRTLGEKWPVPLEVIPFAHRQTMRVLETFGTPKVRMQDGAPRLTDARNLVVDLHAGKIDDPAALERSLKAIPGIVETGLFVERADVVIVADAGGVRTLTKSP